MAALSRRRKRNRVILISALALLAALAAAAWMSGWLGGSASDSTGIGRTGKVHPRLLDHELLNYERTLAEAAGSAEVDPDEVSILIEKSMYRLTVLYRGEPVKQYPVVFGANVEDDKLFEGDGCVPEGRFRIQGLYPHEAWSRLLLIDYPNAESWRKHEQAKREGLIPGDIGIGGEIGIHGVPPGEDYLVEEGTPWTGGCTAMTRADVEELYGACQVGTPVEIVK